MRAILITIYCLLTAISADAKTKAELFTRDSVQLLEEIKAMSVSDQQYRKAGNIRKEDWPMVERDDSIHTVRMIAIINTYGFPSRHRFENAKVTMLPHIILVHAPLVYADTLRTLLAVEKTEGRIAVNEYAHIIWHLDGRKDAPAFEGGKMHKRRHSAKVKF